MPPKKSTAVSAPKKRAASATTSKAKAPPKKKPARSSKKKSKDSDEEDEDEDEDEEENSESESGSGSESENSGSGSGSESESENDEESEEEEEEEDEEDTKKNKKSSAASKKKPAKKASKKDTKKKKKSSSKSKSSSSSSTKIKTKQLKKIESLEIARKAFKWWAAPKLPNGINWRYLEHPGLYFPPAYVPHNIPLIYDGKPVKLTPIQEEIASFFAAIPLDGPHLGNEEIRPIFEKNFFDGFKESLGGNHEIKEFSKCDFSLIREHLEVQKNLRKVATQEEKAIKKLEKEKLSLIYSYALIDGRIEKMGNFNMEPPGLFRGRGLHPKTGSLKHRTFPEKIQLNISEDACPPIPPIPGHSWGSIRHDNSVTWLSTWTENVQQQIKYVMLSASSSFKGQSDMEKYQKAIQLKGCISKIRNFYYNKINSKSREDQQLGVAMWVIDVLALRVGGEKNEDEADTVGCCTLRVEHLTFLRDRKNNKDKKAKDDEEDEEEPEEEEEEEEPIVGDPKYQIELEFLGKDSMLYKQRIDFSKYNEIGIKVYERLASFCEKKKKTDEVFDTLNPTLLNKQLNNLMPGLSAKVFRTYNASVTLEEKLPKYSEIKDLSVMDKMIRYNAANREVAILCNHQRTVSKSTLTTFENLNEKLSCLKEQKIELEKWLNIVKKKKDKEISKIPLKKDDKKIIDSLQNQIILCNKLVEEAKTNEEKFLAHEKLMEAKAKNKEDQKRRFQEKHLFKSIPTESLLKSRISQWEAAITKLEADIKNRDENKDVALGTSKNNYMDPRISVAWCKSCEVPIDKVFAKTLRDKFNWAMAVPPTWKFE